VKVTLKFIEGVVESIVKKRNGNVKQKKSIPLPEWIFICLFEKNCSKVYEY